MNLPPVPKQEPIQAKYIIQLISPKLGPPGSIHALHRDSQNCNKGNFTRILSFHEIGGGGAGLGKGVGAGAGFGLGLT